MNVCEDKDGDGVCDQCGKPICPGINRLCWPILRRADVTRIRAISDVPRPAAKPCPHLLGPNGESVRLFGCGCGSTKKNGILVSVLECDLHDKCVIFSRGTHLEDESIVRCVACSDNPANQSLAEQPAPERRHD